jgi:hypothetical protein
MKFIDDFPSNYLQTIVEAHFLKKVKFSFLNRKHYAFQKLNLKLQFWKLVTTMSSMPRYSTQSTEMIFPHSTNPWGSGIK